MDAQPQWWVWLVSGLAVGAMPLLGAEKITGILQALIVLASPAIIFTQAGAAWLPFALFYGGLVVTVSATYRLRRAGEDRKLRESIEAKKKAAGRR